MRDLAGKLDRLYEMTETGQITRRFALERAAAMGEHFEAESHREDLAEAVLDARRALPRERLKAHKRCEALLNRWLTAHRLGIDPEVAAALKEKLRTSRPSDRMHAPDPTPVFDTYGAEVEP